tara:strand:- start:1740 stop:2423 length:684 start_codon:yes stop_codon:yes gene_type:complete
MVKITAIIPIKDISTRVPGKNFRSMNGKPLFFYIINTLIHIEKIDNIVIDTNSPTIFNEVPILFKSYMNKIILYNRPKHLCPGNVATNDLLINVVNDLNLDSDYYLQTHVTNPLLRKETIEKSIDTFLSKKDEYESLFSVRVHHTRFYNKDGCDMNHNRFKLIPTQDLDPIYEENSCIYIFNKHVLNKYNARIGKKALLFPMDDIESQDIDWENDFILTELLMSIHS